MKTGIYWQDPEYPRRGVDFIFDPSLVLYLPLYQLDGASFMSRDGYGHLCTVTGALWTPRGRSFDGSDDYIDCGNNESLDITDAITIEVWVNLNGDSTHREIIFKDYNIIRMRVQDNNKIINYATYGGTPGTEEWTSILGTTEWYYIAYTYDGSFARIFLNAQLDMTPVARTGDLSTTAGALRIGWYASVANFNGLISEVRIYNRALTPLEIQHNYLATKWRYR